MLPLVEPARLVLRRSPFSHPDWLFELKFDGFRSLAYFGETLKLVSRKGNVYKRFAGLCDVLVKLKLKNVVMDGEIVAVDDQGRPSFYDLMFRRGEPRFAAFDILWKDGKDLRSIPLRRRKQMLRKLIPSQHSHILYVDHVENSGMELFNKVCELDIRRIEP